MPVKRNQRGKWVYRKVVKLPDGKTDRIYGTPSINTKAAAEAAERAHIDRVLNPIVTVEKKEVPKFSEWFWGADREAKEPSGRFWIEWVIANKNKPSEREGKMYIYKVHLRSRFGRLALDEIDAEEIASFRAALVKAELSEKRINNVLAVLSKSLRWAEEAGVIDAAPRIRFYKVERPEIEFYGFEEYARLLAAAAKGSARWYAAVCLAGEAGLRVGEVKALRFREDVDLTARTVTVDQQVLRNVFGTPKGRTRRTIPMTDRLYRALKAIETVREGVVLLTPDGEPFTDSLARSELARTCRLAGLPERAWHILRHSFATHAAMFGINPWTLNAWMGHKRMEETMRYVHIAENHHREIPDVIREAAGGETDLTRRALAMLSARAAIDLRGIRMASGANPREGSEELQAVG